MGWSLTTSSENDVQLVLCSHHHSFHHIHYDSQLDLGLLASSFHVNQALYDGKVLLDLTLEEMLLLPTFFKNEKIEE